MPDEIRKLLLYLRRSTGKYEFSETEIMNVLSIKSRYLTPDQVREFMNIAMEMRCLTLVNGIYRITCSLEGVEIGIDYRPDFNALLAERGSTDITDNIISEIMKVTGKSKKEIVAEINKMREKNPYLSAKVAVLVLARLSGVDVSRYISS
jgi:hypothetical protein